MTCVLEWHSPHFVQPRASFWASAKSKRLELLALRKYGAEDDVEVEGVEAPPEQRRRSDRHRPGEARLPQSGKERSLPVRQWEEIQTLLPHRRPRRSFRAKRWGLSWQKTLRTEVSLGVHLTLTTASRWRHTSSLQSLIDILRGSPNYTNQYTNPPQTSVNDE